MMFAGRIVLSLFFSFSRLAFFELTFQFCTTQQLQSEVIRHYSKQVRHRLTNAHRLADG